MGCNCHNDETPLSCITDFIREFKQKVAEVKQLWQDSKDGGKITTNKDQLGFKPTE